MGKRNKESEAEDRPLVTVRDAKIGVKWGLIISGIIIGIFLLVLFIAPLVM